MQVTVGSKYQIVIPKEVRKKIGDLKPGNKVIVKTIDDQTITIKKIEQNWTNKTRGIAQKAWGGINTTRYLEDLRNEWDRKTKSSWTR